MKKTLLLAMILLAFSGCKLLSGAEKTDSKPEEKKEVTETTENKAKFNVGDTVVAKWAQNSFYEGKIEKVDGSKITVKWSDGSNPSDIDMSDVFALPKSGETPDVKTGEMVLAKLNSGTYWNGAEVSSVEGEVIVVKNMLTGASANLSPEKIIKVTPAIAADLKDKAGATDFTTKAQAKKPAAPAGYKPKAGEKVLGEWTTNSWWQGKVEKISGDKATIAWEDGSKPSEISLSKVMPLPTSSEMPEKDQYLLVKPESGTKWQYAQVTDVKDKNVEVKFADGKTRTLKANEFVKLN